MAAKRPPSLDRIDIKILATLQRDGRSTIPGIARYEARSSALIDDAELGIARIVSHIALRPVHRFTGLPVELLLDPTRS